ncbi:MAG: tetratricopeptide (TPR) repeat protein [Verrucomicrobiales bacterium]|jgi:tetratricopeptide (TPR) repeat protein
MADQAPYPMLIARLHEANCADRVALTRYICELVLEDNPDNVTTLVVYAINLNALSLYAESEATLDRAEPLTSNKMLPKIISERGHTEQKRGTLAAAEALYLRAHQLDPDDADCLSAAASAAFHIGDLERAEEARRREGCLDDAYFNLDCYRRALEIDSHYSVAKHNLDDTESVLAEISNRV